MGMMMLAGFMAVTGEAQSLDMLKRSFDVGFETGYKEGFTSSEDYYAEEIMRMCRDEGRFAVQDGEEVLVFHCSPAGQSM